MNKRRIDTLDFYKAVGALLVVLIHVTATPVTTLSEGTWFWIVFFINRLAKPAVPMFVFASGLALYHSYRNKEFRYVPFLAKRATKIVIPYVCWSVFYYSYYVFQGIYVFSPAFLASQTINGRMMYHFYFVVAIVQFYLLFGILRTIVKKYRASVVMPAAIVINIVSYAMIPGIWIHRSFLASLVYFLAGCYFAKNYETAMGWLHQWRGVLTAIFLLAAIPYCYMFYLEIWKNETYMIYRWMLNYIYFVYCTSGLLLYYRWMHGWCGCAGRRIKWIMNQLNGGSYYIYLAHPFGLILAAELAKQIGVTDVMAVMGLQLGCVAVAVVPLSIVYVNGKKHMFLKRG